MAEIDSGYFRPLDAGGEAQARGLFSSEAELDTIHPAPGVHLTPMFGEQLMLVFVRFDPHSFAPMHRHPQEQIGTMIEGEYEFEMGGERRVIRRGDVYVVPPNVPHAARTYDQGCLALDVFTPHREGFAEAVAEVRRLRGEA